MRILTTDEQDKLKLLTKYSISLTILEPTATGLQKSIMDATNTVRNYLYNQGVHDYSVQKQGPEGKIMIDTELYGERSLYNADGHLYGHYFFLQNKVHKKHSVSDMMSLSGDNGTIQ